MTGCAVEVRARTVVVATGVWAGELVDDVPLRPSKGAHLVVRSEALGNASAGVSVLAPGSRSRWIFTVPRPDGLTLVGLTDDPIDGPPVDVPTADAADRAFLLSVISTGLRTPLTDDDVVGSFAGLRPLFGKPGGETADLSRRHALLDRDGVLVLVGGKLTTYRAMAQDAVDRVVHRLGRDLPCATGRLPLVGAAPPERLATLGAPQRLVRRFGTEAPEVAALGAAPIAEGVPVLRGEVEWAVRVEGALTVDDVLDRRLRLDLVPQWRAAALDAVTRIVAEAGDAAHR
jgi:glycerol-3-phosphate dehydrogenase